MRSTQVPRGRGLLLVSKEGTWRGQEGPVDTATDCDSGCEQEGSGWGGAAGEDFLGGGEGPS